MTNKEKLKEAYDLINKFKSQTDFNGTIEVFVDEDFENEKYSYNSEAFGLEINGKAYDLLVKYDELEGDIRMFFEGYSCAQQNKTRIL